MHKNSILLGFLVAVLSSSSVVPVPIATVNFPNEKQGDFAKGLKHYHIVTPEVVDQHGTFISHDLTYHRRIRQRSLSEGSAWTSDAFYKVSIDGKDHHLNLSRNDKLVAPGFVVERKHSNVSRSALWQPSHEACHYHGFVKSRQTSKVAVSTCYGLRGYINDGEEEYFIEPVLGHDLSDSPRHPHIMYRPSSVAQSSDGGQSPEGRFQGDHESSSCGVKGEDKTSRREKRHERTDSRRQKRSMSIERNVETLVVVDSAMNNYYREQNQDVETFVLTIMNMVSALYHDATLGNAVNIVMVRLMLLDNPKSDLDISHHADSTLKSFCKWQQTVNPSEDSHPNHHDTAVLLTRINLCANMNRPCGTLGLAEVSGMCQPGRSCSVNEDTGLALAFTLAHEMGHTFGMKHDGENNGCKTSGERPHVMSPLLSSETSPLMWSSCSRRYITRFLDRGWGECLNDEPGKHDFVYPTVPPGVMYDVDHQCRLQYGSDARYCDWMPDLCDTLWCQIGNECHSRLESAAVGTTCGEHKWCFAGACLDMEDPTSSIDGSWGKWSEWSECTRTCGAGISSTVRSCDNPAPRDGGKYCVGQRKRYRICNVEKCTEQRMTFREYQCAAHDTTPFQNRYYQWVPVIREENPCELHCKPSDGFFSTRLADAVVDGTPCSINSRDMCIDGVCMEVGCDYKINSGAKEDLCGVCHGDGSSCKKIRDEFNEPSGLGYVEATVIPVGARNIRVEEVAEANNYLAVRGESGQYYLNGHWFIQWSGEYQAAGTTILYERTGNKEKFSAPGPTKEALHIMLLFQSENPGVTFEYTIPKSENETVARKLNFLWNYGDWSHCTKTCGGGTQTSTPQCVEKVAGVVDDNYCNITMKPDNIQRTCNAQDCPPMWWTGAWQHCSATCGKNGTRMRSVLCVRTISNDEQIALSDELCHALGLEKPVNREPCDTDIPCPEDAVWITEPWSKCSVDCGLGIQTRDVRCKVAEQYCDPQAKPLTSKTCKVDCLLNANAIEMGELAPTIMDNLDMIIQNGAIFTYSDENDDNDDKMETFDEYDQDDTDYAGITFGEYEKFMSGGKTLDELLARKAESEKEGKPESEEDAILEYDDGIVEDKITFVDKGDNEILTEPVVKNKDSLNNDVFGDDSKEENEEPKTNRTHTKSTKTPNVHVPSTLQPETTNSSNTYTTATEAGPSSTAASISTEKHVYSTEGPSTVAMETTRMFTTPVKTTESPTTVTEPMGQWIAENWSECSVTCGRGNQRRNVTCSVPRQCDHSLKPDRYRPCHLEPCHDWVAGPWSECSVTCGTGVKSRSVECIDIFADKETTGCHSSNKPKRRQTCTQSECPASNSAFSRCNGDKISSRMCRVIQKMGKCANYSQHCCSTCGRITAGV